MRSEELIRFTGSCNINRQITNAKKAVLRAKRVHVQSYFKGYLKESPSEGLITLTGQKIVMISICMNRMGYHNYTQNEEKQY